MVFDGHIHEQREDHHKDDTRNRENEPRKMKDPVGGRPNRSKDTGGPGGIGGALKQSAVANKKPTNSTMMPTTSLTR